MAAINLGNVVGLLKSETAPTKTYILWAKILDPLFPNIVEIHYYDGNAAAWLPLVEGFIKVSIDAVDFSTAGLTNDLKVTDLLAGYKLEELVIKHKTAVVGTGITGATVTVGIAGDLAKYSFSPLDVFSAVSSTNFADERPSIIEDWDATTEIRAELTSVGANLDQVTDGVIEFYLHIKRVKQ